MSNLKREFAHHPEQDLQGPLIRSLVDEIERNPRLVPKPHDFATCWLNLNS